MKKINIIDTALEYKKLKKKIDNSVFNVLKSGVYINGPEVEKFELELSDFLNVKHCISCANGTDALKIALLSLGLSQGDEILVPSFTFVSTAEVVVLLGFKPVFVDVDFRTFLIDIDSVKKNINPKTRAIIPVHLFGQPVNMKEIMLISKKHNLWVVEDAAQSLGSQFHIKNKSNQFSPKQYTGTIGHIGTTSFYPTKNLNCFGDGGALFTNNGSLAKKIRLIKNHGQVKKYTYEKVGLNSRLDAIQAAILRVKLKNLRQSNNKRRSHAKIYNSKLKNIKEIFTPHILTVMESHIFHQYTLIVKNKKNRDLLKEFLIKNGVSTMIYYPRPLHKEKPYSNFASSSQKSSEELSQKVLSLPIHPLLSRKDIEFISELIIKFFNS